MRTKVFVGLAAAALIAVAWTIGGSSAIADAAERTIDVAWNGDTGGTPVSDDEAAYMVGGTCSYWKNYYCSCTFCSGCRDVYAWTPCTFFCSFYYDYYGVLDGPYACGGTCGGYWSMPYRCGTGITSTTVVGG